MLEKLRSQLSELGTREKAILAGALVLTVVLSLWVLKSDHPESQDTELGLTIPKGFLVVPLELSNSKSLDRMVSRNAIVDVFDHDKKVAENLRVIKLEAGEGPLFGALVPESTSGHLQQIFSRSGLRGALKTLNSGPTKFYETKATAKLVSEVEVND